jgi:ribonuclease J
MTRVSFLGGVGVIGSTKILLEQDGWRVLLDMGLDIPHGHQLLRHPVRPRRGRELADRLRVGEAPQVESLYRPGSVGPLDLATGSDGRTAVFISHAHLDHIGLSGWVDPDIGVHASPGTARMMAALEDAGSGQEGGRTGFTPLDPGQPVAWGPFEVRRFDVDHDVDGASGYLVRSDAGVLAYTGDIRWHGRHPDRTTGFADAARDADFLVVDCTALSADMAVAPRSEAECDAAFAAGIEQTPGLVLATMYPRNVDRVSSFAAIAAERGRTILWPSRLGSFLTAYGMPGIRSYDELGLDVVREHPDRYVVQVQPDRFADLLDLPLGPGSLFLHADGEPLGPFDLAWTVMHQWLEFCRTPFAAIRSSGHSSPGDLHRLVARIRPRVVFPLHTAEPYRFVPPPGTLRVLAERGRTYRLEDLLRDAPDAPAAGDRHDR